ncbi:MAG: hypothetical protein MPJ78_15120 [Hyphomicrobiaceae bacterium]|nr:hypothetical protein [Hyphomicrobiaceae bacterium]
MIKNELDRLRTLANIADQVCGMADNGEEARRRINHLISKAEDVIKTKSLEIQMQQSHIALLKQLDGFMNNAPGESPNRVNLSDVDRGSGPRAIAVDGKSK